MNSKPTGIIERTAALSLPELDQLTANADYVLHITVTSALEQEYADFEGGDIWIFEQYRIQVDKQLFPAPDVALWSDDVLIMPGIKAGVTAATKPLIGTRYFVFYHYNAMARGYSLEGMMPATAPYRAQSERIMQRCLEASQRCQDQP